jgi:hypothetical protein
LRDQKAIERITVVWLKSGHAEGVTMSDGQPLYSGGAQSLGYIGFGRLREWQSADPVLDRDLP